MQENDQRLEMAMGQMLRIGVAVAALIVLAGGILYLVQNGAASPDYSHFHGAPAADGSIGAVLTGVLHMRSESLIGFGILILIATPVCRVIFGLVGFSLMKDRLYAVVSAIVLAVLLFSLFSRR
jgi:uncharacterized membrane protein